ncbi:zinc-ribbon domain-containing protein [Desulfonispora thiosulfatigenes DSM 11270]|uniref:Zinc-ribbon domain-containing protein n=1 Tax=Desulfonispora thiosulfatigenes DSM 11270 TaxID=656914 RepID=A0A1W1VCN9_DESTI|nr:zinc ribbon domain-containing protein [Desulfonispora thiosulfatigenes]SMB91132.1 zinc-ribbon domain-containing protein [Desulfonispora thiosulfatigenes DSM 11270]
MSFFEKLGDHVEYFGQKSKKVIEDKANTLGQKSKEIVGIARLNIMITQLEIDLKDKYTKLGAIVYKSYREENLNTFTLEKLCHEIDVLTEGLDELNAKLDELQLKPICPKCGEKNMNQAIYCSFCGNLLPKKTEDNSDYIDLNKK